MGRSGGSSEPAQKLANDAFWKLVDTAPAGVYAFDADLRMVRINRIGIATLGEIDNLLGRSLDEVLHILRSFEIQWSECDGSPVIPPTSKGFRSTFIDEIAGSVFDADVRLDYAADGVRWQLKCAIENIRG